MLTRSIVLVAAACLMATGSAVPAAATSAEKISWKNCPGEAARGTEIRCADLSVPVDWHRPGDDRTTVRLARLPAQDPAQRAGSLLVNLGADGSTAEHLPGMRKDLAELTRWFDVIAFDARGRGGSSGVACETGPAYTALMFSSGRRTWDRFVRDNRAWEASCRKAAGPLAGNLDSWQAAHDMEAIRRALGEGGLSYYGNSYGTVFGKAYAELFPAQVRRMYLDSVADHTRRSPLEAVAAKAEAVGDAFEKFGKWCESDAECALHPDNARDVWDGLTAQASREPLPAPDAGQGKTVDPVQLRLNAFLSVPQESRWPRFAQALAKARAGNASDLHLTPSDVPTGIRVDGLAWCADFPFTQDRKGMTAIERRLRKIEPRAGWLMAKMEYGRCVGQRHQGSFPPHAIAPEGLPPVLLVSGLRDTATPPSGGRLLAGQLPGSAWVRADSGHSVYLSGNRCVRDLVHRYLRTGARPAPGHVCPA
ncbi:alpha/beta fold hydrolase [Nonomuraea sp. KC401]|uniref:alpha/beta hydrolase n=1 Tax=unclassified Nonomuraea TaxID=2593643 RepID=UPI0010FEA04C|nr:MULTISPECIES: alpha/beta hydrolase [unclassified Nonomuraea]NBE95305.1 alpha/beta fold hydrolase [Nonomuraea sp. K271]TLF72400.1 alpha/beta fold hydrolase [Nonomuraea sp. KC401]